MKEKQTGTRIPSCAFVSLVVNVLLYPLLDLFQRAAQVLHRVRDAESQVALAKLAERSPRKASHASFFQQRVREWLRFPSRRSDIWEDIERAHRHAAGEAPKLNYAGNDNVGAPFKFAAH